LVCENKSCKKNFLRLRSSISNHNYCSRSCAARVNNQKFPKRATSTKICIFCHKEYKGDKLKYCSVRCKWAAMSKYSKQALLKIIQNKAAELHRTPSRRELDKISFACIRAFGSWNDTLIKVGLTPHRSLNERMYKRVFTIARDGHKCDSISEAIIDNWLTKNKIVHERNKNYPNSKHLADWSIRNGNTFVEYFGLARDSKRYDETIKTKRDICKRNSIKLIEIYPENVYPVLSLDKILKGGTKIRD